MKFSARLLLSAFLLVPTSALWTTSYEESDLKKEAPEKPVGSHHTPAMHIDQSIHIHKAMKGNDLTLMGKYGIKIRQLKKIFSINNGDRRK